MDGNTIKLEAADAMAPVHGFKVFWTNAKRRFESILNSICNIAPHHDLDAYERQRIETLAEALERVKQTRINYATNCNHRLAATENTEDFHSSKIEFATRHIVSAIHFSTGVTIPTFTRHLPSLDVFLRQIWRAF
jgi:hypothetical protein